MARARIVVKCGRVRLRPHFVAGANCPAARRAIGASRRSGGAATAASSGYGDLEGGPRIHCHAGRVDLAGVGGGGGGGGGRARTARVVERGAEHFVDISRCPRTAWSAERARRSSRASRAALEACAPLSADSAHRDRASGVAPEARPRGARGIPLRPCGPLWRRTWQLGWPSAPALPPPLHPASGVSIQCAGRPPSAALSHATITMREQRVEIV